MSDVLLATTWERGCGPGRGSGKVAFDHYLWGLGVDLNLSGVRYSKVNFYYRDNDGKSDNWQMTVNYALPFDTGNHRVLFDGFMDWTSATSDAAASMNFISQLKYDIGGHWGWKNTFYVGTEYVYWINKFGVRGVDEHSSNLLLEYHF